MDIVKANAITFVAVVFVCVYFDACASDLISL